MVNDYDYLDRYQEFVRSTAIYPEAGTGTKLALAYAALGLVGEGGEVSEKIKKFVRDGKLEPFEVAKELGDVLWYVTRLAEELRYDLKEIFDLNIDKLQSRKDRGVLKGSGDNR